jgi:ankyrin repeat protein
MYYKSLCIHMRVQLQALIDGGADVNRLNVEDQTVLYMCCQDGHTQILDALIEAKADVNIPAKSTASPVFIASQMGRMDVVQRLVKAKANLESTLVALMDDVTKVMLVRASF